MFIDNKADHYSINHTSVETDVLKKLNRETHAKILRPRMLSGHYQGKFLEFISCMMQPCMVLEIGTYTGYSAICLSRGLKHNGKIHTIDHNEELEEFTRAFFDEAGISRQVIYHIGEAMEIIPELDGPFDLVFIDADKENYTSYYELVLPKLRTGGVILADNVLWSGKVFADTVDQNDEEAKALIEFNEYIQNDSRVENILLPIRDGLMMIRKL
jgi:caffeoyl-CoA O-methyltransferase